MMVINIHDGTSFPLLRLGFRLGKNKTPAGAIRTLPERSREAHVNTHSMPPLVELWHCVS